MSKKKQLIIGYFIFIFIIFSITILYEKDDLKIEETNKIFSGSWNNKEYNSNAKVSILDEKNYNINYQNNLTNCSYNFKRNVLNLNFESLVFDLLYLEVLDSSCNNDFKNQKIVFKIDKSNIHNVKLKYVSTDEISYLINNIKTSNEIKDNLKKLLSLFNIQNKFNNQYNNFLLTFKKEIKNDF